MRPLSQDLRVRFCRALDRGMSARGAARMLEVSAATGVRWAQAWRQRGSTLPGKVGGHMRPLLEGERDWLLARIERKKDLTLHALLAQLREERVAALQTFQEFMERRLAPAMNTCAAISARLESLSQRVTRATQLLSTRIEITRERQNQQLLESMNRRAETQLRLQQTVEGLSVAAITYYAAGLINYVAKGLQQSGLPIDPALATALGIPVVAVLMWLGVRRVRRAVTAISGGK